MEDADGWTKENLLAEARNRGFSKVSARQITDWTELGLLDNPRRRGTGRGSKPAVWTANQAELYFALIAKRRTVKRIAALYNIPVFVWLNWGDDYVPIRQVRKVMRTFIEQRGKTTVAPVERTAKDYFRTLGVNRPTAIQRDNLNRVLSEVSADHRAELGIFEDQLTDALHALVDNGETPSDQASIDDTIWAINCRLAAASALRTYSDGEDLPDATFRRVQFIHQQTARDYLDADPYLRRERLDELANDACVSLLFQLGRELTAPIPPSGTTT